MDTVKKFKKKRYVHLENLLDKETCAKLTEYLREASEENGWFDEQCPTSKAISNSEIFDKLLLDMLPTFEKASGLKLLPTYAYARYYRPSEVLKIHRDRPSCEVSATLTLGFKGDVWPIYMGTPSKKKTKVKKVSDDGEACFVDDVGKIEMEVGDGVLYRGCELYHWRDEYIQGKYQAQVFLHYVDANGPYTEWIYDKRGKLNLPSLSNKINNVVSDWFYTEGLDHKNCDDLLMFYTQLNTGDNASAIESELSNRLNAIALNGNAKRKWNFLVARPGEVKFIKHNSDETKYFDTFNKVSNTFTELNECPKLITITFLTDSRGKFFIQLGNEKLYPPQVKGTILVLPGFVNYGFEATDSDHFILQSTLLGPWFK